MWQLLAAGLGGLVVGYGAAAVVVASKGGDPNVVNPFAPLPLPPPLNPTTTTQPRQISIPSILGFPGFTANLQ
jgi:hypothetical protein